MIPALGSLLALFGALGLGAFLLHLRQLASAMPQLVLVVLALLMGVSVLSGLLFGRQLISGGLRSRSTVLVAMLVMVVAAAVAVTSALLQMAGGFVIAKALPTGQLDYGSIGVAVTRLLAPSFFTVLHCLFCFFFAISGIGRRSVALLVIGVILAALTLYVLVGYAKLSL